MSVHAAHSEPILRDCATAASDQSRICEVDIRLLLRLLLIVRADPNKPANPALFLLQNDLIVCLGTLTIPLSLIHI